MAIRIRVEKDGRATVESISILEDLWHDFQFFKEKAGELDQTSNSATERLVAKRYRRAALLSLVFYFEGVLNRWLEQLLSKDQWRIMEEKRTPLKKKIDAIQSRLSRTSTIKTEIEGAKKVRDMLAHLKSGTDIELFDSVTGELLESTEAGVTAWLNDVESSLSLQRHPDSRLLSAHYTKNFAGERAEEGYTGPGGSSNEGK